MTDKGDGKAGPFWLGWKLSEQARDLWTIWAKENDIAIMPAAKLHFTQFYAPDEPADKAWPQPMQAAFTCRPNGVAWLGKALLVLFDAPQFIQARFTQLASEYQHSFSSLIPHMSLFYNENATGGVTKEMTQTLAKLNRSIGVMPDLTFVNEDIDAPNSDEAAMQYLETAGFVDLSKHKSSARGEFLSAFGQALSAHPELVEAWQSGDREAYRKAWVEVLRSMDKRGC